MSQQHSRRISYANSSLDELLEIVDLERQYIVVGFLAQTADQRRAIRHGTSRNEGANLRYAKGAFGSALGGGDDTSGGGGGISCLPLMSLLIAMVRGYTSMLRWRHCEVALWLRHEACAEDRQRSLLAIGVQGDAVFIEARAFDEQYHWVYVGIERSSLVALLTLAVALRGERFNMQSMSRSALFPGPEQSGERHGIFCSQLAAKLLSLLPHPSAQLRRPNAQTVDDIFELVSQEEFQPRVDVGEMPPARLYEYSTLAPDVARLAVGSLHRV